MQYTYWLILLFSIAFPLTRSFGPPLYFHKKWKHIFPAILLTAIPFLIWDSFFTRIGIWGFNDLYISGWKFFGLPLEEISFFIVIPYCCMFIYEVVRLRIKIPVLPIRLINATVLILLTILLITYWHRGYTASAAGFGIMVLTINWITQQQIFHLFYPAFLFMLIPFLIVNGLLTGSFIHEEVVWYNDAENMNFRFFTIPLDDFIYCFGLMLSVTGIYEFTLKKFNHNQRD